MPSRSFTDFLAPLAFVLALLLLALGYGFVAARHELFAYTLLSQAEEAAGAFWKVYLAPEERSAEVRPGARSRKTFQNLITIEIRHFTK